MTSKLFLQECQTDLLSVIMVNYNAGEWLTQAAQRVLDSDTAVELFVLDNASEDDSFTHLLHRYGTDARLHSEQLAHNLGFAAAVNRALPHVRGAYILILNPDCLISRDTLSRLRTALDAYPQAGMAGVLVLNEDGSEQASSRRHIPTPGRALVQLLFLHRLFPHWQTVAQSRQPLPTAPVELEGISGAFMCVRRAAVEQVGLLDERYFLHCEDLDWFMRFQAAGWRILFVPQLRVTHLKGVCSRRQPLRVSWYKHRAMLMFYRKFFRHSYPAPLLWVVSLGVWLRFSALALLHSLRR